MTRYFLTTTLALIVLFSLHACYLNGNASKREVISQMGSSDGQYTAFIVQDDGGATTAYDYKVLLRHSNSKTPFLREPIVFRSYGYPVPKSVRFTGRKTIEILCDEGSVFVVSFDERTLQPNQELKFYKGKPWDG